MNNLVEVIMLTHCNYDNGLNKDDLGRRVTNRVDGMG